MANKEMITRDAFARLEDDWEGAERYLSMFIDECQQTLDELTEALLSLEAGGGRKKNIETLFIAAHRIKGSAASIGLNRPAKLAHAMEDILQILVDDGRTLDPKLADGMLACTDGLRQYVGALKTGRPEEDQFADLAQQLAEAQAICDTVIHREPSVPSIANADAGIAAETVTDVENATGDAAQGMSASGVSAEARQKIMAAVHAEERGSTLVGQVVFDPDFPMLSLKAMLVYDKLSNMGAVRFVDPSPAEMETREDIDALCFAVVTDRPAGAIQGALQIAGVRQVLIESLAAECLEDASVVGAPSESGCPAGPESALARDPLSDNRDSTAATRDDRTMPSGRAASAAPVAKPTETLRVDIERLDRLMNLAGQLVIGKARVAQIGDRLKEVASVGQSTQLLNRIAADLKKIAEGTTDETDGIALRAELESLHGTVRHMHVHLETVQREVERFGQARAHINDLFETIHLLDGVSDGIRQSVMDMRMLPIGPLFGRFHRVIRDITRNNGKDIRLEVSGEKTDLDKRMIDELGDPMIHLVRNSADHGIESPETRAAAGKPRQGVISLDAFHRGSNIVICVSDDGKGLDVSRIRAKAIEKGLVSAADAESMSRQQIFQFIWHPGLSTAEKITDVSGRGVGMDIVRSKIKDLNGVIDVDSEPGRGTTFTIKLPLTLAVLPSLMVEIDDDAFAIPLESVVEIVCVHRSAMRTVHGQWTAPIRDRVVALLPLGSIFRWHGRGRSDGSDESEMTTLVILGEGSRQLGLPVHRVIGEEDVVIKSIADNYRNVTGIAGATILGDGRISLILDPTALIEMSSYAAVSAVTT